MVYDHSSILLDAVSKCIVVREVSMLSRDTSLRVSFLVVFLCLLGIQMMQSAWTEDEIFSPSWIFGDSLRKTQVSSPSHCLVTMSGPGLWWVRLFLITPLLSSAVIALFWLSASSSFTVETLHFSRNMSVSPRFHFSWHILCHSTFYIFFCIPVASAVVCPVSFLMVFIWVFLLFCLTRVLKSLSILFKWANN